MSDEKGGRMSETDVSATTIAKTDQINADDLLSGPIEVTVTGVIVRRGDRQPVDIRTAETPGRVYRPCLTMRRVLVAAWGPDGATWIGRRIRLYRDDTVRFDQQPGGIRISHLSDHPESATYSLQETRGKRRTWTIHRLPDDALTDEAIDAYLTSIGKPAISSLTGPDREKADAWVAGLSAAMKAKIRNRQSQEQP